MFRIRPIEKNLTEGEYHCCVNGRTPAEYDGAVEDDFDITDSSNLDGTTTTRWTVKSGSNAGVVWEIHFSVCCKNSFTLEAYPDVYGEPAPGVEVYFGDDSTLVFEDQDIGLTITQVIDDQVAAAAPFFPVGPCGLHVVIIAYEMDSVGSYVEITI